MASTDISPQKGKRSLAEPITFPIIASTTLGSDPIEALAAFDRLDPSIVKYLGADRLDLEEAGR
jgi:hypothetical protein